MTIRAAILAFAAVALIGFVAWSLASPGGCPAAVVIGEALRLAGCDER